IKTRPKRLLSKFDSRQMSLKATTCEAGISAHGLSVFNNNNQPSCSTMSALSNPPKIAIVADSPDEVWPSMDLVSRVLVHYLRRDHASEVEPYCVQRA